MATIRNNKTASKNVVNGKIGSTDAKIITTKGKGEEKVIPTPTVNVATTPTVHPVVTVTPEQMAEFERLKGLMASAGKLGKIVTPYVPVQALSSVELLQADSAAAKRFGVRSASVRSGFLRHVPVDGVTVWTIKEIKGRAGIAQSGNFQGFLNELQVKGLIRKVGSGYACNVDANGTPFPAVVAPPVKTK